MKTKIKKTGFTIIELLIVAAIIGLLSAVVLQSLNIARQKSRNTTRLSQIDQINKAIELSATGGQNKLPYSGGNWVCLGSPPFDLCANGAFAPYGPVNLAVVNNIAGGVIPKDPSISTGSLGDYYLYHSDATPGVGFECNGSTCPRGAYLSWVLENSTNCGRGKHWANPPAGSQCLLRIGDEVTN